MESLVSTLHRACRSMNHLSNKSDNLALSTGLIIRSSVGHRKEIRKLTFRALALRGSESRNCGLCVVYIQKDGATLLIGAC